MNGQPFWAYLVHLSMNMWSDAPGPKLTAYADRLRFDDEAWFRITTRMAEVGCTMIVIDVGDGIRYESHPEVSVVDAWSPERLDSELDRLRGLGLEPIPKLNFSATHDAWLGEYARMVSTTTYYQVVTDLITEVAERFGQPRFFHLGMDEESSGNQGGWQIAITRQRDLWWHDLELLVNAVERAGSRAWVWSDQAWAHPDEFYGRMSQRVLQSNWYYHNTFSGAAVERRPRTVAGTERYLTYLDLDEAGFDQVPTGSTWVSEDNLGRTVDFIARNVNQDKVLGFLQTNWAAMVDDNHELHESALAAVARARAAHETFAARHRHGGSI